MPYNVKIQNEQGEPLPGAVYFYDAAGNEIGLVTVRPEGSEMPTQAVQSAVHFWITSPGYSKYGTSTIYEDGNVFTLVRSVPTFVYIGIGALTAFLFIKLVKPRL